MPELGSLTTKNAVVYPTYRSPEHPGRLLMGVFDEQGYVEGSVLDRRAGERGLALPAEMREGLPTAVEGEVDEAIYAGAMYRHFGHFLLESTARLWYAAQHPELPVVWAGASNWDRSTLERFCHEILEILGVTNDVSVLTAPTRFRVLHVPEVGYRYDDRFHPDHARFLAAYDGPPQEHDHRLWLSRTTSTKGVRDLNSETIERRLVDDGWTVLAPEKLSVKEQLDALARAETIAGEEGSAFHTLMLLRTVEGKKFHIFRRLGAEHRNMLTIGERREVDQEFHTVAGESVLKADGRYVTKTSPGPSSYLDALGVPVAPYQPEAARPALVAAIRAGLSGSPGRYLEVGDPEARTIAGVEAESRVAAAPQFAFDPRALERPTGARLFEAPLHLFRDAFAQENPADVIRLSGPASELAAQLDASSPAATPGTVWIVDGDQTSLDVVLTLLAADPKMHLALTEHGGERFLLLTRDATPPQEPAPTPSPSPTEETQPDMSAARLADAQAEIRRLQHALETYRSSRAYHLAERYGNAVRFARRLTGRLRVLAAPRH